MFPRGVVGSLQISTIALATRSNSLGWRQTSFRNFGKAANRQSPSPPLAEGSGLPPASTSPTDSIAWTSTISSSSRDAASAAASSEKPLPGADSALKTIHSMRVSGSRASSSPSGIPSSRPRTKRKRERFLTDAEFTRLGQVFGEVSGNRGRRPFASRVILLGEPRLRRSTQ